MVFLTSSFVYAFHKRRGCAATMQQTNEADGLCAHAFCCFSQPVRQTFGALALWSVFMMPFTRCGTVHVDVSASLCIHFQSSEPYTSSLHPWCQIHASSGDAAMLLLHKSHRHGPSLCPQVQRVEFRSRKATVPRVAPEDALFAWGFPLALATPLASPSRARGRGSRIRKTPPLRPQKK